MLLNGPTRGFLRREACEVEKNSYNSKWLTFSLSPCNKTNRFVNIGMIHVHFRFNLKGCWCYFTILMVQSNRIYTFLSRFTCVQSFMSVHVCSISRNSDALLQKKMNCYDYTQDLHKVHAWSTK